MLVLAAVAIAAGAVSGILVEISSVRILLAATGVVACTALVVFARKATTNEDATKITAEARRMRDEWRTVAGEARALRGETAEVLSNELQRLEANRNAASARILEEKVELGRRERVLGELRAQVSAVQKAQTQAIAAIEEWLGQRGAQSGADYRAKVQDRASREEKLRQQIAQQSGLLEKWKCANEAALKSECISRIEVLNKVITDSRLQDPDVKLKENQKDALRRDLESQEARREDLLAAVTVPR